jgi:pantetheine-phosphate adenylyltransferase
MLNGLGKYSSSLNYIEYDNLEKAILFHDAILDTKREDNEERSYEEFLKYFPDYQNKEIVRDLIIATKRHIKTGDKLSDIIIDLDLDILKRGINELIEYEHRIFKEYQFTETTQYIIKRCDFLTQIKSKIGEPNYIDQLIQYILIRKYSIGIYPGSFDPFHIGHLNIKRKAEEIFDKVIIARGINPEKEVSTFKLPESLENEIVEYKGLVTELFQGMKTYNISKFFVRGLRNVYDIGYEENLRKIIHDIDPSIKFVYFFCDSGLEHISSSQIRALIKFNPLIAERYLVE